MIYTPMTKKAIDFMFKVHNDQVDKSGLPYVFHPWHLAEQMDDEISTTVALLHDTIEDSRWSNALDKTAIENLGFPIEVVESVKLLSHLDNNEPYLAYIERVKLNPIAKKVKLADLKHNSDVTRLNAITAKDRERIEKYRKAIRILEGDA